MSYALSFRYFWISRNPNSLFQTIGAMFYNACVQILQKMDKTELRALKAFIKQRGVQKKQENSLFNYLYDCYPDFNAKDLEPAKIISIFKDTNWANPTKRLSNIGNSLTKIIEDFLVEQALKKNWSEYEFLLAFEYSRLGLPELLDRKIDNYLILLCQIKF